MVSFVGACTWNPIVVYLLLILQRVTETRLTLNATGSVLLHRQWEGRTEQRKFGLSVRTSSAGWSAMISAMLRFSCGRSLGTAAAASGCPVGELTSFIFPGTGWRLLDGGLNLRVALGSTGIRITTAWIIKEPPKSHPNSLKLGETLNALLAEAQRVCQRKKKGLWAHRQHALYPRLQRSPWKRPQKKKNTLLRQVKQSRQKLDVLSDKLLFQTSAGSVHALQRRRSCSCADINNMKWKSGRLAGYSVTKTPLKSNSPPQMLQKKVFFFFWCLSSFSENVKRSSRCVIEVFVQNWKPLWKPAGYVHTDRHTHAHTHTCTHVRTRRIQRKKLKQQ